METPKKSTIVIIGATGSQGSSVARTFLELPNWHIRCITRNPNKALATDFASQGAELAQADLNDPVSLERALQGAEAIFLNTDFWETWRPAKAAADAEGKGWEVASARALNVETTKGKNVVDVAAALPSLERMVVSTLANVSKISGGKFDKSKQSQAKDWIVEYIKKQVPNLARRTSYIYLGAYRDNALVVPRYEPIWESTGKFDRALIEDEDSGTKLLAYDNYPTMSQMVCQRSEPNGKEAVLVRITIDTLREKSGLTDEHLDAFAAFAEHDYVEGVGGVIEPHDIEAKRQVESRKSKHVRCIG